MKGFLLAISFAAVLAISSNAIAQGVVAYMPVGPAPAIAYYAPATVTYAPVTYGPVVTTAYYAPVPYLAPAPVVMPYYAASPVVAYYGGPVAVAPVYGRPVIVRPKVYIPGQPVRNVVRAVTP